MAKKKSLHVESKLGPQEAESTELSHGLRLATVRRTAKMERYKDFLTEGALRALIFDAEDRYSASGDKLPGNGMAIAIIRLGRKVLIDLDAFDEWLVSHRAAALPGSARAHRASPAGLRK